MKEISARAFFPRFYAASPSSSPLPCHPVPQVRDHSSVDDIARGVIAAALQADRDSFEAQIFNLGSGDTRELRTLVADVVDQLGLKVDLRLGARPDAEDEPMFMVADTTRARGCLQWNPRESVAQAVWRLARISFPFLSMKEPVSGS